MASKPLTGVLQLLRARLGGAPGTSSDGHLLERFTTAADGEAFAALMERHAGLVWQVCQRVLGESPDVDDAFQATFFVLLKKASSLERERSVASWLYGVAYRVALKAREKAGRQRRREQPLDDVAARQSGDTGELRAVLDVELSRLPDRLRVPLVLCYLQGKTNEQAADELGLPAGSMSKRLAQARELLRERLVQRGLAYSAATLTTALANEASAAPPPALLGSTSAALISNTLSAESIGLAKGVLRNMFLERIKLTTLAVLALGVVVLGAQQFFRMQAAAFVPLPDELREAPLAKQPRLPIFSAGTLIGGEAADPLVQVGVFPEEAYVAFTRTIPGIAPSRLGTLVGAGKRFDLAEARAGQPISVVIVGPRLNSDESIRAATLTRQHNTFTLVLELWRDNGGRFGNVVSRGAHLLSLGNLEAGDFELRVRLDDMFLDYQQPLPRYYRQVGQEAGKLPFKVLAADAAAPRPRQLPALERAALKKVEVLPADKQRDYQHPFNGHAFTLPEPSMPPETLALGSDTFNFGFWLRDQKAGKLPPSLTKVGRQQTVHVYGVGPVLNSGEWLQVRAIEWQGKQVRLQVEVWRDQAQRGANVLHQNLVEATLRLPQQELNQVASTLPGKYEVVIDWVYLQAPTQEQPYGVQETKTTRTTLEVE